MRKIFSFVMVTMLTLMLGGCQKYDDSELRREIEGLKTRLAAIETLNTYKDLLAKLENGKTVIGVSENNGVYTLTFDDNSSITFNQKGEPGESITGPEGQPGVTPQFRIDEETVTWEVSYDEGKTWKELGSAVDRSLISNIENDEENGCLLLTLADGTVISLNYSGESDLIAAVDIGLKVKWGECNLGASAPEDYGDYYSWGETTPKTVFDARNKWFNNDGITKYNTMEESGVVDNLTELEPEDDAATVILGSRWRIPTKADFLELIATSTNDNYTWTWTEKGGHKGLEITLK